MDSIKVNKCCAICNNYLDKDKCPLYSMIRTARDYGYQDDNDKFIMVCTSFKQNVNMELFGDSDKFELTPLPSIPNSPYPDSPYIHHMCKSWSDCTNPCFDCINCPLRGSGTISTFTGTGDTLKETKTNIE